MDLMHRAMEPVSIFTVLTIFLNTSLKMLALIPMTMKTYSALSLERRAKKANLGLFQCLTVMIFFQMDSEKALEVDSVRAHSVVLRLGDQEEFQNLQVQSQRRCNY
jgi:hypothetical protein